MYNYKMTIAYDGTLYCGWQVQPNGTSIQELIQKALKVILRCDVNATGAGRTDAGVHACAQIANFKTEEELNIFRFKHSLNGLLPHDIRILEIIPVPEEFHAQRDAVSKIYHYYITTSRIQDPFKRLYRYHVREKIDIELLHKAAKQFVGTHDFTSFSNEAHLGAASKNAVRKIMRLDLIEEQDGWRLEFEGDGFLYKMVRNIVGTMLDIAKGNRQLGEIPIMLAARDRRAAGQAAPAHGLFLIQVAYPD
jgi:tRNA pseudouridine38-40 synthase